MKKILLGTTALAATLVSGAAMAEEPIKLSLGGYFRAYGIYQDSDIKDLRSSYLSQQGRIAISGSTTLDNGITAGVYTQLRAGESANQNNAAGTVRRAYGFFEGSFGRLEFGSADGAATQMGYASPDPAPSAGVNSPNFYPNAPTNAAGALGSTPTTYQNWDGQNTKLSYFTPRISGFQFGVSYSPSACQTGPSANNSGRCAGLGNAETDNNFERQSEVWQLGANYSNTFNGVDVGVSGTFQQGTLESNLVTTTSLVLLSAPGTGVYDANGNLIGSTGGGSVTTVTTTTADKSLKDRQSYSFGTNISYSGFTLGASYLVDNKGVNDSDVNAWDVGLKYVAGPWSAGVQYIDSKRDNPTSGIAEDSVRAFTIGGGYALGPGIDLGVAYQNWSWDSEGKDGTPASALASRKNDADMFLIGTVFKF